MGRKADLLPIPQDRALPVPAAPERPAESALAGYLSRNTKKAYTRDVLDFFRARSLAEVDLRRLMLVTPEDVMAFRDRMLAEVDAQGQPAWARSTIARKMSSLRAVYRHLLARGLIKVSPVDPELVRAPKMTTIRLTDRMERGDAVALLRQPDRTTFLGKREYAMLILAIKLAPRREEICTAKMEDLERGGDVPMLRVRGKGEKHRRIPLGKSVWEAIEDWLRVRPSASPWLFCKGNGGRLSESRFYRIVKRYALATGIDGMRKVHPHSLRANCIRFLIERGVPISEIQQLVGHSRGETTLAYVRELDLSRSKVVDALEDLGDVAESP